ncbi:MAG: flagellar basal body L-ring protein FlgH [Thermoguttaceae bacterium]
MKTHRIFLCCLLASCFAPALAIADDGPPAEPTAWHEPVELRFQLGDSDSCSVLCATEDYRIEAHEKTHSTEQSARQVAKEKTDESDVSQASAERLRHFAVSGQLIALKTCDRMLLTFELTCESGDGGSEKSRREEKEHGEESTQQAESEKSFHAQGSTLVECGKTYTLAQFGEKTITVSVGRPEGVVKQAALQKGDHVLVIFDNVALTVDPDHSSRSISSPGPQLCGVSVIDVRHNGDLVIEGYRTVRVDGTIYEETMTGTIRPKHVSLDRQISRNQISELRIHTQNISLAPVLRRK